MMTTAPPILRRRHRTAIAIGLVAASLLGCGGAVGGGAALPCGIDADCPAPLTCAAGWCNAASDAAWFDAARASDSDVGIDAGADGTDAGADATGSGAGGTDADADAADTGPGPCTSAYECDDGDPCTGDACLEGVCSNGPKVAGCCASDAECEDGTDCTLDRCEQNQCVAKKIGTCCEIGLQCDDGDPCTDELCDTGICVYSDVPGCNSGGGGRDGGKCGDGACDAGEGCQNCPQDCGACGSCGDGTCGFAEDCQSCSADCGSCASSQCSPGSKCCTAAGTFAPKGTECGTSKLSKTYTCSGAGNGSDVLLSYKVGGCTGSSTLCSTSSTYAVPKLETYKNCASNQKCQVSSPTSPGSCVQGDKCTPGTKCCPDGQYAPKGTACGTSVYKKVYSCSGATKGATIFVQQAYAGCSGSSTTCSTSSSYLSWTGLTTYKKCSSSTYCKVSSSGSSASCSSTP